MEATQRGMLQCVMYIHVHVAVDVLFVHTCTRAHTLYLYIYVHVAVGRLRTRKHTCMLYFLSQSDLEYIGVDSKGLVYWYDGGRNMFQSPPHPDSTNIDRERLTCSWCASQWFSGQQI